MRALAALLVVVFGWSVSLAFVSPCSVHGEDAAAKRSEATSERGDGCCPKKVASSADRGDHDDDGRCSCPIDCGDCCDGAGVVALPPDLPVGPVVFAELTEIPVAHPAQHASDREPRDILHVPRAA